MLFIILLVFGKGEKINVWVSDLCSGLNNCHISCFLRCHCSFNHRISRAKGTVTTSNVHIHYKMHSDFKTTRCSWTGENVVSPNFPPHLNFGLILSSLETGWMLLWKGEQMRRGESWKEQGLFTLLLPSPFTVKSTILSLFPETAIHQTCWNWFQTQRIESPNWAKARRADMSMQGGVVGGWLWAGVVRGLSCLQPLRPDSVTHTRGLDPGQSSDSTGGMFNMWRNFILKQHKGQGSREGSWGVEGIS